MAREFCLTRRLCLVGLVVPAHASRRPCRDALASVGAELSGPPHRGSFPAVSRPTFDKIVSFSNQPISLGRAVSVRENAAHPRLIIACDRSMAARGLPKAWTRCTRVLEAGVYHRRCDDHRRSNIGLEPSLDPIAATQTVGGGAFLPGRTSGSTNSTLRGGASASCGAFLARWKNADHPLRGSAGRNSCLDAYSDLDHDGIRTAFDGPTALTIFRSSVPSS